MPSVSNVTRVLHQATVVDVISNPGQLTEKQKNILKSKVANGAFIDRMPRNSILAVVLDPDGTASLSDKAVVLFPLFSGHLCMPIKPGERVFVIYENAKRPSASVGKDILGFWITRISTNINIDDVNYTCMERTPSITSKTRLQNEMEGTAVDDVPAFPNGPGPVASQVFQNRDGFEEIVNSAYAFRNTSDEQDLWEAKVDQSSPAKAVEFTGEAVPRYSKICSDLCLQGSNNTLIALTEDKLARESGGDEIAAAGSIDIVAGRGQSPLNLVPPITNTRGYPEADKNSDSLTPTEGDIDFLTDLSRVYISMKTNPDGDFGLTYSHEIATSVIEVPSIVIKSDELRLVARSTGSVRLIKEGGPCEISMLGDNAIAMDGTKIYLGYDTGTAVSETTTLAVDTSGLYTNLGPDLFGGAVYTSGYGTGAEGNRAVRGDHLLHAFTVFLGSASTAISLVRGNMGGPIPGMDELIGAFIVLHSNIEASLSNDVFLK